jgi:hypothetical protein
MIEMATLTGESAAAVTHTAQGLPANCAALQGTPTPLVAAPSGGLSGTLTLINVASGMDFTVNADALAELATRPFHRPATDPYPDFNAGEIDAVSVVTANGSIYRSTWNRPADAISAVLMRNEIFAEYVLDPGTHSHSDIVLTFPTRQYYLSGATLSQPFGTSAGSPAGWAADCNWPNTPLGTQMDSSYRNREERGARGVSGNDFGLTAGPPFTICAASAVLEATNGARSTAPTEVLGSTSRGIHSFTLPATSFNGWLSLFPFGTFAMLQSLPSSTRLNISTGALSTGAHVFAGLPVTGFHLRTFVNGTLTCGTATCQGNYGGSFPLKYRRVISPSN